MAYFTHIWHMRKKLGVSTAEYGILGALIAVVMIASVDTLGTNVNNIYCTIEGHVISSTGVGSLQCIDKQIYGQYTRMYWSGNPGYSCGTICVGTATSLDSNMLAVINQHSAIVGIAGMYDAQGNPITDLNTAIESRNMANGGTAGTGQVGVKTANGSIYMEQIKTTDNNTYGVFYTNSYGNAMGYQNLDTGETYIQDRITGTIQDIGVIRTPIVNGNDVTPT